MNGRFQIRDVIGILGLILLLVAFFVLLENPIFGWALVFVSTIMIAYSLYTDGMPNIHL